MDTKSVGAYLSGPFQEIKGWCSPHLWQAIQPLAGASVAEDGIGPIAEIGIFHGKFFIGLVKTMGAPANNYAIDVFDMQKFNLDHAGKGDLEIFRSNLALAGVPETAVEIVRADSMTIGSQKIREALEKAGGFSLFSIDGCHMAEHTINDFEIACQLTRPSGIIFVDDYHNPNWPGVAEGIAKIFLSQSPCFVPLLHTGNKLFFCHISYHQGYLELVGDFFRKNFSNTRLKPVKRFGYNGLMLAPDPKSEYLVK